MRVVHYLNQFFSGLGGEVAADAPVQFWSGPVGPGVPLQQALGSRGEVVGTIAAGDTYVAEHEAEAAAAIGSALREADADVLVAGPAFNAGRYGLACGLACQVAQMQLGIAAVTAMHPDNPAVEPNRRLLYILPTSATATDMRRAVSALADFAVKLGSGEPVGRADAEGYLPRGFRRNEYLERTAAQRVVEMLHAKLAGRPFTTEIPIQSFDLVVPAPPLVDAEHALLALVTEAGLVPRGNPDRIRFSHATNWAAYSVEVVADRSVEVVHGGYDASFANSDPNRVLPLDALRDLVDAGEIGGLLDQYYVTVGNGTPVASCALFGDEIARELAAAGVQGVVLPAT
jgi:glycine reductase